MEIDYFSHEFDIGLKKLPEDKFCEESVAVTGTKIVNVRLGDVTRIFEGAENGG